ncbi:MAG: MFS transporter [Casimicrobiaceae bacterium]
MNPASAVLAPPALPLPARGERALLLTLLAMGFTNIVDFMIMMPLAPYLIREWGISTAQFGMLVSAYAFSATASSLAMIAIADRFDRKRLILVVYAGLAIATAGCALAPSYATLLAARIVAGAFGGVQGSIAQAIIGDAIPDARRGRATALVLLAFSFSAVIGVPLGIYAAAYFGWRAPFAALALLCLPIYLTAARTIPEMTGHVAAQAGRSVLASYFEVVREPNHLWVLLFNGLVSVSGMIVIPFIAPTRIANEGMSETALALFYLVGGAMTLFTRPLFGRLTDRYHRADVFYWLALASIVPMLLITHPLGGSLWVQIPVSALFFIFVSGRFVPMTAITTAA